MMRLAHRLLVPLLIAAAFASNAACFNEGEDMLKNEMLSGMNKEAAPEVRRLIADELQVGAGAQEIEAFFERHEISYSYDRFSQRYQAIMRDVSPVLDQAVVIHVYVDDEGRFQRAEVHDSFTAP